MKNFDKYYDPPEDEDEETCQDCDEFLGEDGHCGNVLCPSKFTGNEFVWAVEVVKARREVAYYKNRMVFLNEIISIYDPEWKTGHK